MAARRIILVVDCDEIVQRTICSILRRMGYCVLSAVDAPEAARLIAEHASDLALMVIDVVLNTVSGPEFVGCLPTLSPRIPVLFISALGDLEVPDGVRQRFRVCKIPLVPVC